LVIDIYELALKEDLEPDGDLSTKFFSQKLLSAQIIAKEPGVFACSQIINKVFSTYHRLYPDDFQAETIIKALINDGDEFEANEVLFEIKASSHALLICERTTLNFLQRACAIATKARFLSELIKDYDCQVLDTRKSSPGLREIEKQAFRQGGGTNHRFNLSSMAMLKENHLASLGLDLEAAIRRLKSENCPITVEINKDNLGKLELVCKENVEQIMFDNFGVDELPKLVQKVRSLNPKIKIEASGGITEKNIINYAKAGIDFVSTAEASRARNIDLSMLIID
jgi:nicotinate-nucleotide pyrophosphorylase (carboxylating)